MFVFILLVPHHLNAQILPKEGSELNYRLIGFSVPKSVRGSSYVIEIATGTHNNADSFQKNIIKSFSGDNNRIIIEVPSFGSAYTWRAIVTGNDKKNISGKLHHFRTLLVPEVDSNVIHLRILNNSGQYGNDYVFVDGSRTLYDMEGHPVWYLPVNKDSTLKKARDILNRAPGGDFTFDMGTRDLKVTSFGTLTFIDTNRLFEINYNGDIVWKGTEFRDADSLKQVIDNYYHHEFTRLSNGHYMALGISVMTMELAPEVVEHTHNIHVGPHSEIRKDSLTGKYYQQLVSGTLVEIDQKGKVTWSWKSSDYFKQSDLYARRRKNGMFKLNNTHENAFYFDEQEKLIYVSFKNINRILKIRYPSGKISKIYGTLYSQGEEELNNDLFCGQHSCRKSMDGYLYMYNNNTCNTPCNRPTILILQETNSEKEPLKKIWEYECTIDTTTEHLPKKTQFGLGGNVFELPDRSMFCCMGYSYSKIFIVSKDKNVLWSAIPEAWDVNSHKWVALQSYRASIISRRDLESLIWNEHLKK